MTRWYQLAADVVTITVHAQPGAKRTEIHGLHGDAIKIRVAAPPLEGRANEELIKFLAQAFAVPQRKVRLLSGDSSRHKRFAITGSKVDPASLIASAS